MIWESIAMIAVGSFIGSFIDGWKKPTKQRPIDPRRLPRCKGKHDFFPVATIRRECVSGCHVVKGQTVVCRTCHTAGQIWEEPETATPTFEVAPSSGAYR